MDRQRISFTLGNRLEELRKSKGLTHVALAKQLKEIYGIEVSRDSLMAYEISSEFRAKASKLPNLGMRVEYLYCLADFYGVSIDYLLKKTDIASSDIKIREVCEYIGLSENAVKFLKYIGNDPDSEEKDIMPLVLSLLLENYKFFQALSGLSMACRSAYRYHEPSDIVAIEKFKNDHWPEIRQIGAEIWSASSTSDMFIYQANGRLHECMEEVRSYFIPKSNKTIPGADTPGTAIGQQT